MMVIWIRVQVADGWNRRIPDIFKIVVIRLGDDLNLCSEEDKYQQDLVGGWKWKSQGWVEFIAW